MSELVHPKIISGNSNITLSKGIASWASSLSRSQIDLVEGRVEQFNDQEIFVEVFENVRNEDMFIIQSTSNPANDNIMELLIMLGVIIYAYFAIDRFADDVNPYNFSRRDNDR